MATLIENKNRILSVFNDIKNSILNKGQTVESSVASYANAIYLIGQESFICDQTVGSSSGYPAKTAVPNTLTYSHTFNNNANVIVRMETYAFSYNTSNPDICKIYLNDEEIGVQTIQHTGIIPYSRSSFIYGNRISLTKVSVQSGDTLRAEYTVNNVGSGSDQYYGSSFYQYLAFYSTTS